MKSLWHRMGIVFAVLACGFLISSSAYARHYRGYDNQGFSISISTGSPGYYRSNCHFVPGHWYRGNWVPGRTVCDRYYNRYNQYKRCYWTGGYWHGGVWYPRQKICRY